MDIPWIKLIVIAAACAADLLLAGAFFKKTLRIDPRGEFGAAGHMASFNGTAVLYAILAAASLLLARYVNQAALYVGGAVLLILLGLEAFSLARSRSSFRKNLLKAREDGVPEDALRAAENVFRILTQARLFCSLVFLAFLSLMVWL